MLTVFFLAAFTAISADAKTPKTETTQYWVSLHCVTCQQKVMDNLAFEKGVKDIKIDLEKRTVDVTYNTKKTDAATILTAIERLGYEVKIMGENDIPAVSSVAAKGCCSYGADKEHQCKEEDSQSVKHDCPQKAVDHQCKDKATTEKHDCKESKGEEAHNYTGQGEGEKTSHKCTHEK